VFALSNWINIRTQNVDFGLSNGGMTVFLTVLGLSGSELANDDKEKDFILWLGKLSEKMGRYG
jgi:hypothetical protein